jgi:hypothetical protein
MKSLKLFPFLFLLAACTGGTPKYDATFFSFGLLSFSHTYAIHSFGLTVLLGVIFSFIYATLFTSSDAKHVVVQQYQPKS